MAESDLDQLIAPVYKKYANPVTTILAAAGEIQVHLRARCATVAEAERLLAEVGGPIDMLLGDRIYSRNGDPWKLSWAQLLRQSRATVAVAESCTGGMLGERFTSVPGSSDYFLGGFITYSNAMKTELLGVSPETLDRLGPSAGRPPKPWRREPAAARVRPARYPSRASPVPPRPPVPENAPVGTVYIGIADAAGVDVAIASFSATASAFARLPPTSRWTSYAGACSGSAVRHLP